MSMDPKTSIIVPEDRDGLYAIDVLDPDMVCDVTLHFMHLHVLSVYAMQFLTRKTLMML